MVSEEVAYEISERKDGQVLWSLADYLEYASDTLADSGKVIDADFSKDYVTMKVQFDLTGQIFEIAVREV